MKIQGDTDLLDIVVSNTGRTPVQYSDIRILSEPLSRLWNPREGNTSVGGRFEFDQTARWWTLFQAALWDGCEGQELDTNQIAGEALDDKGANLLFEALNRQSSLKATGIAREMIREDIPAEYWELATTNPNEPGHYVSFIDDAAGTYWGTLTPAGEHEPHWNRINIDSKALKRIFPFGKAKPVSCRKWLEEIMRGSPNERPKRKYDYLPECKERFGVSKTGFERAWREALDKVPEAKPNWTKGGRPKKTFELIPPPNKSPSPI